MGEHGQSELEDWKVIPSFPSYEICSDGRVRNRYTGKYKTINWISDTAYVVLYYKGKVYSRAIGKLLRIIHGIEPRVHTTKVVKCPNCGGLMGSANLDKHLEKCKPRDPNIKYFEY